DPCEIGRNEVIAAALAGDSLKATAREGRGRTRAAEMDDGGEILLLLRICRHIAGAGENGSDIAVEIHRREFDSMARDHADGEAGEAAIVIDDVAIADTEPRGL